MPTDRPDTEARLRKMAEEMMECPWGFIPLGRQQRIHAAIAAARAEGERAGREAEREACAVLHESIDPACDHERTAGHPGAGAMRAIILYRDAIRARANGGD